MSKPKPQTGDFSGKVIDSYTGEPVPEVTLKIGGLQITSDEDGKFSIASLTPGYYQLILERDWYNQATRKIHHIEKQDSLIFSLVPEPLIGKLLYSLYQDGNWEIYELNLADRSVTRLSNIASDEINPVKLSNDEIIFQSDLGGAGDDLYKSSSGGGADQVSEPMACCSSGYDDEHPSVDQTGTKMAFKSMANEQIMYYDMEAEQLISVAGKVTGYNPVINSGGDKVAFVSGDYKQLLIYTMNGSSFTKSNEFNLYSQKSLKLNNPCWSPDGNKIAFEAWASDGVKNIYFISVDDGSIQQVTYCYRTADDHEHPCWSKDGTLLFFVGTIFYSSRKDIYCIKIEDGLNLKEKALWVMLTGDTGNKNYPTWASD